MQPAADGRRGGARQPAGRRRPTRPDARRADPRRETGPDARSGAASTSASTRSTRCRSSTSSTRPARPSATSAARASMPQQALALHNSALALNRVARAGEATGEGSRRDAFVDRGVRGRCWAARRPPTNGSAASSSWRDAGGAVREAGEADAVPARPGRRRRRHRPGAARAAKTWSTCCSTTTTS